MPGTASSHDATTRLVRLRDGARQALEELALTKGSTVSLLVEEDAELRETAEELLLRSARDAGFAAATLRLGERVTFDSLAAFLAEVARKTVFPDSPTPGLASAVARASKSGGPRGVEMLRARLTALGAEGELLDIVLAAIEDTRRKPHTRLDAWLDGTKMPEAVVPIAPLEDRTAVRALRCFSRLVQGLGARGLFLLLREGDSLRKLPDGRRLDALTVLRELCDNADGGRGLSTTKIVIACGKRALEGSKGLLSLAPLAMRVGEVEPGAASPHEPFQRLSSEPLRNIASRYQSDRSLTALRTVLRSLQGLPPTDLLRRTSVALGPLDTTVDRLFELTRHDGSAFALLSGAYGTGKTHLLLHVAARAHAEGRPVFRLSLERLDADLGNPQRHLTRLIEGATLGRGPEGGSVTLPAWLEATWTDERGLAAFAADIVALSEEDAGEATEAAIKLREVLRRATSTHQVRAFARGWLLGSDLQSKPGQPSYRRDAYRRFLLWLALLERRAKIGGPVLLLDEAENLFAGGASRPERRTALRTLAFYCGGHVPRAAVFLAVTPEALAALRQEAPELVEIVGTQKTTLPAEDVAMLRNRLKRAVPVEAPALGIQERLELCERLREVHEDARGAVRDPGFGAFADGLAKSTISVRLVVRKVMTRLERAAFVG